MSLPCQGQKRKQPNSKLADGLNPSLELMSWRGTEKGEICPRKGVQRVGISHTAVISVREHPVPKKLSFQANKQIRGEKKKRRKTRKANPRTLKKFVLSRISQARGSCALPAAVASTRDLVATPWAAKLPPLATARPKKMSQNLGKSCCYLKS